MRALTLTLMLAAMPLAGMAQTAPQTRDTSGRAEPAAGSDADAATHDAEMLAFIQSGGWPPLMPLDAAGWAELSDGTRIRPNDLARLDTVEAATLQALREARHAATPADYSEAEALLAPEGDPMGDATGDMLIGDWTCRIVKLGRAGVYRYSPFVCRIALRDTQLWFSKLTGSQRVSGALVPDGERLVLLGVGYAGDVADPPGYHWLGPDAINLDASPQITAQPGLIERLDDTHLRIRFPYPMLESTLDVMELTRP